MHPRRVVKFAQPFDGDVPGKKHGLKVTKAHRIEPKAVYDGGYPLARGVRLRIAAGGPGNSGLVEALSNAFIQYMVESQSTKPFKIAWYLSDTIRSLEYIEHGMVDIAITHNKSAEEDSLFYGHATKRMFAFCDRFLIVGPTEDPAELQKNADDEHRMLSRLCRVAKSLSPNPKHLPIRFVSRGDGSATHIRECALFSRIGQAPWADIKSTWYHTARNPTAQSSQATLAHAANLSAYTLTDLGTYLSAPKNIRDKLHVFRTGSDDLMMNPSRILMSAKVPGENADLVEQFMEWMDDEDEGGQSIVSDFEINGQHLYSIAPPGY
ncbi:hypothetical protein SISSUDRAFT_686526 [Sistotremastrum suecicum HHB10207 ss-3]|uniref:PBP domain-containing protein n=1 Tax=Sistotremastrum suecicum HHB10207 ss-3 TaxID=1314776 RepID=A0A166I2V8_9AGAM|nr:hypothetical protein SISSUDRAFT_686526 [Sistotremastrum suecicum HHB10207 ss-3]